MKILVAEDDVVSLTALKNVLLRAGHEVVVAADGLEAWRCLQRPDAPQIAVLDWMMPGLDGPEICRRLRAQMPQPVVYLLLLTGKSDPEDVILGLKAGADDFLRKPFNPTEIKARLEVGQRVVQLYNDLAQNVHDLHTALQEQQLNLDQARKLLTIANAGVPRWIGINDSLTLHLSHHTASSQHAGGDHCWACTLPGQNDDHPVTLIGLRDQSGHEVNCILRSIATDLFHKDALKRGLGLAGQLAFLNDRLCASGMFAEDDFVTGLTLELDHATLQLRFVSCGHPPMFLIRQTEVIALPADDGPGRNLPLGSLAGREFEAGQYQLLPGDRLVLFTDGLLELGKSIRGTVLSIEEISQILTSLIKPCPDLPVGTLVQNLLDAATGAPGTDYRVAPPDDVTVLGLEIEPDDGPGELVFHPAGLRELDQAILQTWRQLTREWKIEADLSLRLRLLLDEALTNAWRHGNRQNPILPITVRWGQRNGYALVVEDVGNGFDVGSLPDPLAPASMLNECGRGMHLIRTSCERADWKKGGTRLVARLARPESP